MRFNAAKGQGRGRKQIYTYCGHICIAVNPFEWLDELYTTEIIARFRRSMTFDENEPHVYAVATVVQTHVPVPFVSCCVISAASHCLLASLLTQTRVAVSILVADKKSL